MRVLLVGPYPPPHGGISVHLLEIRRHLTEAGVSCQVLDPHRCRNHRDFARKLSFFASDGWTIHLHANGHNFKSWLLALLCGRLGFAAGASPILTLHSGMAPAYLRSLVWRRQIAAWACRLYGRVICVNSAIQQSVVSLGLQPERTEIAPAFLEAHVSDDSVDPFLRAWMDRHSPLFASTVFFRPEYGVDLLIAAMARLRRIHPSLGCLLMGDGERCDSAMRHIRHGGLDEHILLLGDVEHDRCLELISKCDVFLRATLEDGDSVSVREALGLGVPVVASRVGTRPEGVLLFQAGNVEDLLHKIEVAMAPGELPSAPVLHSMERLMEIYRQSEAKGAACV